MNDAKFLGLNSLQVETLTGVIAFLALILTLIYNYIFKKSYRISKKEFNNKLSNFTIYLIEGFRLIIKENQCRYLLCNITIRNKSLTQYSFTSKLEVHYEGDDNLTKTVFVDYTGPKRISSLINNLTFFTSEIELYGKAIESNWLIFEIPVYVIKSYRILKYVVYIIDTDGSEKKLELFLIKDITDETPEIIR